MHIFLDFRIRATTEIDIDSMPINYLSKENTYEADIFQTVLYAVVVMKYSNQNSFDFNTHFDICFHYYN